MNKIIIKIKLFALCFLITGGMIAQQKLTKVSQTIKVDKDVTIDLNTSHCNIVFDTWNKDTVEIEAYIEGEQLSKEELENALKSWVVDVDATNDNISIKTKGGGSNAWTYSTHNHDDNDVVSIVLKELKYELADLPQIIVEGLGFDMEVPEIPNLPEMPEMPELPELPEGVNNIQFNYSAYKKDGEKYLKEYTKQFESRYGKDYASKMEAWGEKFGKEWGEKYGKQMEEWGEKFGEEWGEEFGEKMEAWGERFAEQMEGQSERIEAQAERMAAHAERAEALKENAEAHKEHANERSKLIKERHKKIEKLVGKSNVNVKKTIKIKMPKKAKLKVNVRHGEIEFASNIDNLKADLSHTKFTALSINGSSTSINASYSPVYVTNWNLGELNLNYVKNAKIENVKRLVLNAVSSNIDIKNLLGSAIIDGDTGDLKISKIDDAFTNLNVILQNSDTFIVLPKANYNVYFKGNRSKLNNEVTSQKTIINYPSGAANNNKSIIVNAKYSNVIMQ